MFAGKSAVVTGAAKGIGRATAEAFAAAGARVALLDEDEASLHAVVDVLRSDGRDVLALTGDVASSRSVNEAVAEITAKWGAIDTLVANAGISFARAIDQYPE